MKIASQHNYINPTFASRKKEIRKADDIQRKSKKNFPMFSPAYLNEFYILNGKGMNTPKQVRTRQIGQRIVYKINAEREYEDKDAEYSFIKSFRKETPFVRTLKRIKNSKIGNCDEASAATMAALAANGYYDSKRMGLRLEAQLINKATKEIVHTSPSYSLDHAFVVSSMNIENPQEKDFVVLDSWMGFADSISGARARYQRLFNNDPKIINNVKENFSLFRVDHFCETGEMINWNDYETRYRLVFEEIDNYSKDDIKSLGVHARMMYPHLCL